MSENKKDNECKIISMIDFKERKGLIDTSRPPLFVSHLGKITANPYLNNQSKDSFEDRLVRIRTSLEKINLLMSELKKVSDKEDNK